MYLHIIPLPKTCAWFITSNSNKLNKSISVQNLIIYSSMPSCHTAPKLNWNVNGFPSLLFFKAQLLSLNWSSCSLNISTKLYGSEIQSGDAEEKIKLSQTWKHIWKDSITVLYRDCVWIHTYRSWHLIPHRSCWQSKNMRFGCK